MMYLPVAKEIWYDIKIFLFLILVAMLFSQAQPSDQLQFRQSKTIYAISVAGIMRNISVKLFKIWTSGSGEDVI